jgi:hypothetical protein
MSKLRLLFLLATKLLAISISASLPTAASKMKIGISRSGPMRGRLLFTLRILSIPRDRTMNLSLGVGSLVTLRISRMARSSSKVCSRKARDILVRLKGSRWVNRGIRRKMPTYQIKGINRITGTAMVVPMGDKGRRARAGMDRVVSMHSSRRRGV